MTNINESRIIQWHSENDTSGGRVILAAHTGIKIDEIRCHHEAVKWDDIDEFDVVAFISRAKEHLS